jgi:IclR family acetate operon transcriptional repressor
VTQDASTAGRYSIRAVDRVCDVLDLVRASAAGVSLPEVTVTTGMPKSSAFRYLTVLEQRGYIERDLETSLYRLGFAFQAPDTLAAERLKRFAEPKLARLRERFGLTANLGLLDGGQVVHALVLESPQQMRLAARIGERSLIHSTALGKAMVADLGEEAVRSMLTMHGMPRYTEKTIVDPDDYFAALAEVRSNGFALDDSENQIGGRCAAVAVPGAPIPAGVSVSAPDPQLPMHAVPEVVAELTRIARELARELAEPV